MSYLETTPSAPLTHSPWRRTAAVWMVTFVGFPLGGLTAKLIAGPVDGPKAALAGGLITGAILGAAQAWGMGRNGPPARRWIAGTAVGLAVGLGAGSGIVAYGTTLAALLLQGALCGLAVGAAQAFVLRDRLGRLAFAWPAALAAIWAVGWAVTASVGVQVDEQFTVFGSSGALVVTALTAVLPVIVNQRDVSTS